MNPFDITKAVDYTNQQLNDYWVDFPVPFEENIKPTSQMPMLILGGKGSGKTHIMKYFSYELQKLRYGSDLLSKIKEDGFIGIYWRCSGINGSRFNNKGYDEDFWKSIFEYYSEIWVGTLLMRILKDLDIISGNKLITEDILQKIENLFDIKPLKQFISIDDILEHLQILDKQISTEVNNLVFSRGSGLSENFKIHISPTKLFFELPKLLSSEIEYFNNLRFLFLIDEYENLLEYQQKYFNTLLREKEHPTNFKIGAKHYGMLTYKTYSSKEEIKEGAEFELFNLDEFFRESDADGKYLNFIEKICIRRLEHAGYHLTIEEFRNMFEVFNIESLNTDKYSEHIKKLKDNLAEILSSTRLKGKSSNKLSKEQIDEIISSISYPQNILIEKANILLIYRNIKKNGFADVIRESNKIKQNIDNKNFDEQNGIISYYKNDLLDQYCRENLKYVPYTGFDTLVKMSSGIPRSLIRFLKEIYRQADFSDEQPFSKKGRISLKSQLLAIRKESQAIFEDLGNSDRKVLRTLKRIGSFLQELRFSDLPPECSISIFRLNITDTSIEVDNIFKILLDYSYLIEVSDRREKNSNLKDRTFKLNGAIAPIWELSLAKRGVVDINRSELNSIIDSEEDDFKKQLEIIRKKYNFPFSNAITTQKTIEFDAEY